MLVAVNQQETTEIVNDFLAARDWDFCVGLDRDGQVGRHFQVDALPQLVVIAPGGRIEQLRVGGLVSLQDDLKEVLTRLVEQGR